MPNLNQSKERALNLKYIFIAFTIVILTACGGNAANESPSESNSETSTETEVVAEATVEEIATEEPVAEESTETEIDEQQAERQAEIEELLTSDELTTTESGLQYVIIEEGDGEAPEAGNIVQVHYNGMLEDGTTFDSSYDRGEPIQFALGIGQVIPGWDEGIGLLTVGSIAKLVIPPDLAYGEQGAGNGVIPPNATLIFDVELLGVSPGPPSAPTEVDEADYTTTDSGLQYFDLEEGSGETPEEGQSVVVHYTGWLEDGTMFDSSLVRGRPFDFVIGEGRVIPGWEEGVASMKVGSKRQLVIPAELAYGERGAGGVIPSNATLIFEVELVEIQ